MIRKIVFILCLFLSTNLCTVAQKKTYCNPINVDYGYTPFANFTDWGKHRATADPVIVNYKGDFYLFSTNQWGYWHSSDMLNWKFNERKFLRPWNDTKDELCAGCWYNWRYNGGIWKYLHKNIYAVGQYRP